MIKVTKLNVLDDYQLSIELSNGESGIFDIKPYLNKGFFTELMDVGYFSSVKIILGGVSWPNGQDFSTDTISFELKHKFKRAS